MGFFSDLWTMGPSFALSGLSLEIDMAISKAKEDPINTAINIASKATTVYGLVNTRPSLDASPSLGHKSNSVAAMNFEVQEEFKYSIECERWIEETGGSDEAHAYYYNLWAIRVGHY